MSFQDVRGCHEERDDWPEVPAPEVVIVSCFECGHAFQCIAGDGERFCSRTCEGFWCNRAMALTPPRSTEDDGPIPF
ncbi:MAG: hypothetical protein E6Q76_02200 [Rhizobium sp.]|nr:MAG: hypothetical protein E6Q76_02200 [Rhizobium sp.]